MRPKKEQLEKPVVYIGRPKGWVQRALKLALVEACLLPVLGCDPFHVDFDDVEDAIAYRATTVAQNVDDTPRDIRIMSWNVKFGGGRIDFFFDCHGDRVHMTEQEVRNNLERLAEKIRDEDPDIVMMQEVDIDSKRCAYVDMVQFLLDRTDLNYGAYASQWRADFIPSYGLGRVDSGNAVISRWPITNAQRIALPLIEDQDALTQYFWLRRNMLDTSIDTPNGPLRVINIHTAAFSQDGTKLRQIDRFKEHLDQLDDEGIAFVAGGDLNALPPGSEKTSGFPDSVCPPGDFEADNYDEETEWLVPLYETYTEAIPLADYQADNARYFTHTTDKSGFWNRRLDYIFTNANFADGTVHQDATTGTATMPLSDHAPITVTLKWR